MIIKNVEKNFKIMAWMKIGGTDRLILSSLSCFLFSGNLKSPYPEAMCAMAPSLGNGIYGITGFYRHTGPFMKHIQDFLNDRALPDELSDEFVQAIREALSDLKKIIIKVPDLRDALLAGGAPFNPSEMKSRLDTYLTQLTAGKDPSKVRIVLE